MTQTPTLKPKCDECGRDGLIEYDSQGEGKFWLCGLNDQNHSDTYYSGSIVRSEVTRLSTLLEEKDKRIADLERRIDNQASSIRSYDETMQMAAKLESENTALRAQSSPEARAVLEAAVDWHDDKIQLDIFQCKVYAYKAAMKGKA